MTRPARRRWRSTVIVEISIEKRRLFDRGGIVVLLSAFFASAFFVPLVFLGNEVVAFVGIILWGLGMATQESLLTPLITQVLNTARKATAFGIYDTGYGVFWFAGSWLMGYLYSNSLDGLVIFSMTVQMVALPIFWLTHRQAAQRKHGTHRHYRRGED